MSDRPPPPSPPAPSRHAAVRSAGWWGITLTLVVLGTILAALVYGYVQLAVEADAWPPPDIGPPDRVPLAVAAALLGLSAVAAWRTGAAFGEGGRRPLLLGVAGTVVAGGGAAAVLARVLRDQPSVPGDHAYASMVAVLVWYVLVVLGAGVVVQLVTAARILHGRHDLRLHVLIDVGRLLWWHAVGSGLVVLATIVLGGGR